MTMKSMLLTAFLALVTGHALASITPEPGTMFVEAN